MRLAIVHFTYYRPTIFPKNLLLPLVIPLDHDHDSIAGFEIGVLVVE